MLDNVICSFPQISDNGCASQIQNVTLFKCKLHVLLFIPESLDNEVFPGKIFIGYRPLLTSRTCNIIGARKRFRVLI